MKLIDLFYEKNIKIYQIPVIIYKRALYFYSKHASKRGVIPLVMYGFKSMFSLLGLKIIFCNNDKIKQIDNLIDELPVQYDSQSRFYYFVDEKLYFNNRYPVIGNMPVNYSFIINNSLEDIKKTVIDLQDEKSDYIRLLIVIEKYIDKICLGLSSSNGQYIDEIVENLKSIKTSRASSLTDALQRILLFNSLLIQTGHTLMGLGRIDQLLDSFDVKDKEETDKILKDFCIQLHRFYSVKSQALLGDTGQLMILGGSNSETGYFTNYYTYAFLEIIKKLNLPDPKLLLRVSGDMPEDLIEKSLECIATGNGSPLFSNDDVIIPLLSDYGFDTNDSYNYGVSACWEPVIIGKSMDQNNLVTIPFAKIFVDMMDDSNIDSAETIEDVYDFYGRMIQDYVKKRAGEVDRNIWEPSPLLSLFFEDCIISGKDISEGGAKYNNYGLLSDGLSNAVNSLLNLEKIVFIENRMTIHDVTKVLKKNYAGKESLIEELTSSEEFFGRDDQKCISLTNKVFGYAKNALAGQSNRFGGGYKIGLSSPNYLMDGKYTTATFDGRKSHKPLNTHISCDKNIAYTELISFASQLDYSGYGINGNVIDFMINPVFLEKNFSKCVDLVKVSIEKGFFQMQMNVVSSETLIDAKKHPENYKNLIVRVWGFSAFYVDLPEKYKDMLIERALKNEGKAA